jgi:hypothetical protein
MNTKKLGRGVLKVALLALAVLCTLTLTLGVILLTGRENRLLWEVSETFADGYGVFFLSLFEVIIYYIISYRIEHGQSSIDRTSLKCILTKNRFRIPALAITITILSYSSLIIILGFLQ